MFEDININVSVESFDASAYEGADHIFDLSRPLPSRFHCAYDAVLDGGTIESHLSTV